MGLVPVQNRPTDILSSLGVDVCPSDEPFQPSDGRNLGG